MEETNTHETEEPTKMRPICILLVSHNTAATKMNLLPFALIALVVLNLSAGCNHATEPPPPLADTTSHNFLWTQFTVGGAALSVFSDVAIISDTLAYAVGAVYLTDSSGSVDPHAYNVAKWNGTSWSVFRVQFWTVRGDPHKTPYPACAVLGFAPNDVWIGMRGDQIVRWNGNSQTDAQFLPTSFQLNRMWGDNPASFYIVGYGGKILHYEGSSFLPLDSGTDLLIRDIWGVSSSAGNGAQVATQILAVASGDSQDPQSKVLLISRSSVTTLSSVGLPGQLRSIWFVADQIYYVVGDGIYTASKSSPARWYGETEILTPYTTTGVRGNGANDVFIAGAYGEILHYNGSTWRSFRTQTAISDGAYTALAVKGSLVIAVGGSSGKAIAAIGKRITRK